MNATTPGIEVHTGSQRLPFSEGLLASSFMTAGVLPGEAFPAARRVHERLTAQALPLVTTRTLRDLACTVLSEIDEQHARRYRRWQRVDNLQAPLIVLLGGVTGVGKSTIATQLAVRLRMTRVISTDTVREVLRAAVPPDLLPALHTSSFHVVPSPCPTPEEPAEALITSFREQVQAVSVGARAVIARAVEEQTSIIVEGSHVVPGHLAHWARQFPRTLLLPVVLTVSDADTHRNHFLRRGRETGSRVGERYLREFDNIRLIQAWLRDQAVDHGVTVIEVTESEAVLQDIVAVIADTASAKGAGAERG
ncbi:hypothetical protein GKQ77_11995 [Streptomyces sp. BG9H]|uniref:2-phosphoglycerate kinase n=1 Tax=Streptomyces anatolicus TaxID=2675858 RepID=A0ABS6YLI6_9ACTN|nr:AAA family ATPase [Streptomyces anatolicus]MBW5422275.1 hypothetical protein [Streptomyces anatolicus]